MLRALSSSFIGVHEEVSYVHNNRRGSGVRVGDAVKSNLIYLVRKWELTADYFMSNFVPPTRTTMKAALAAIISGTLSKEGRQSECGATSEAAQVGFCHPARPLNCSDLKISHLRPTKFP